MIIGSDLLNDIGATMDFNTSSITSSVYVEMGRIPFDLRGARQWRRATTVIAECDILLQPDAVSVVVGRISWDEMRILQVKELVGGGGKPVEVMGNRGIEVKHTLQRVLVTDWRAA